MFLNFSSTCLLHTVRLELRPDIQVRVYPGRRGCEVKRNYYIALAIFVVLLALGLWQGEHILVYLKATAI